MKNLGHSNQPYDLFLLVVAVVKNRTTTEYIINLSFTVNMHDLCVYVFDVDSDAELSNFKIFSVNALNNRVDEIIFK